MKRACALFAVVFSLAFLVPLRADDEPGRSQHGSAFDPGLRQKAWKMDGIGHTHFPITTKLPEVQEWFDQGNTLLHSFWFEEAERSFRWCIERDPDCAMTYRGLARCDRRRAPRPPVPVQVCARSRRCERARPETNEGRLVGAPRVSSAQTSVVPITGSTSRRRPASR